MKKKQNFAGHRAIGFLMAFIFLWGVLPYAEAGDVRKQLFDNGWRFALGDSTAASAAAYDDSAWRLLDLPHDWSIEGTIAADAPMGNDGGYFPAGIGWYRKTFQVPADYRDRKIGIYFEGVYMNAEVFINGTSLGVWPYGYSSFFYDLTPHIRVGEANVVAVRVDNSQQKNCRWYSGSGIYRHVWLTVTDKVHIDHWGMFVTTPEVSKEKATVKVQTALKNETAADRRITLTTTLFDTKKQSVGESETTVDLPANSSKEVSLSIPVLQPALWSPDTPYLYEARCTVAESGEVKDCMTENFGIRSIEYSAEKGLLLNGKKIILNGGCLHHDNGFLGAAAYDRAEERKVELMKAAGFNAARTAHNVPSEAFLDACDRLGLLVIDEAFDGWRDSKNKYDYSVHFDKWWQRDLDAMVLRDRNHPSIFCWSIGNEVIERKKIEVVTTAKKLGDRVRQLDGTRPVTSALAAWDSDWEIYDPLAAQHEIVGYNYMLHRAPDDHKRVPSRVIIQTESFPRGAFDNWKLVTSNEYVLGDFVWTALDYLGESAIGRYYYVGDSEGEHYVRPHYPWHGAYCGDIDLTGWRKPISHYRDLLYNADKKLYLAVKEPDNYYGKIKETAWSVWPTWESWNWPGHEGKPIEAEVYSRYPKVRLYLNDELVGERTVGVEQRFMAVFTLPYQPGTLKAVGVDAEGREAEEKVLVTAGEPVKIRLTPDRKTLKADGQDLSFVTVEVVDKEGRVVPDAANRLSFEVKGAGVIAAVGNANLRDTDPYVGKERNAWKGRAMVIVKSTAKSGTIRLKVSGEGLDSASLSIKATR